MQHSTFAEYIIDNNIIGFYESPMTLKSGRTSHFYVNWREATNDAYLLNQLTDYIVHYLTHLPIPFDSLYGVPEGATKTAVITSMKLAQKSPHFAPGSHIISMGRSTPKPHGSPKDRFFIGTPHGKTVILEDTTTTGGSLFNAIDQLISQGVDVVAAVGITDRMEIRAEDQKSVAEALNEKYNNTIQYYSMSHAIDLIPLAIKKLLPSEYIINQLITEFKQCGVRPLNISLT